MNSRGTPYMALVVVSALIYLVILAGWLAMDGRLFASMVFDLSIFGAFLCYISNLVPNL